MNVRAKIRSTGLVVGVALLASTASVEPLRPFSIPAALLGLAVFALLAEAAIPRTPARSTPPTGAKPADGVIEIIPMAGAEGTANPDSPRFRRYSGLGGSLDGSPRVRHLPDSQPALLGRVALISVFIGRDGIGWTDLEIARGLDAIERAARWVEREAALRAALTNVGLADPYFQVQDDEADAVEVAFAAEGDDVGPMEAHASTKAVVAASRAAAALGFADVVDLVGKVDPRVSADARVWLLHVRQAGRSLAIPAVESEVDGVGLAVCYAREASFPGPLAGSGRVDPATVAHELLHLFGASDKYGVPLPSFAPGSVTTRDIMRLNADDLGRMTIDNLTASEIGWGPMLGVRRRKNARR